MAVSVLQINSQGISVEVYLAPRAAKTPCMRVPAPDSVTYLTQLSRQAIVDDDNIAKALPTATCTVPRK